MSTRSDGWSHRNGRTLGPKESQMKKIIFLAVLVMAICAAGFAQEQAKEPEKELNLGRVYFPKTFVHAGKDYNKGVYQVTLFEKEGVPWFKVLTKKKEPLFEELAIVKPFEKKRRGARFWVQKGLMSGYEYFRLKVVQPDKEVIAFFFIKQSQKEAAKEEPAAENQGIEEET